MRDCVCAQVCAGQLRVRLLLIPCPTKCSLVLAVAIPTGPYHAIIDVRAATLGVDRLPIIQKLADAGGLTSSCLLLMRTTKSVSEKEDVEAERWPAANAEEKSEPHDVALDNLDNAFCCRCCYSCLLGPPPSSPESLNPVSQHHSITKYH